MVQLLHFTDHEIEAQTRTSSRLQGWHALLPSLLFTLPLLTLLTSPPHLYFFLSRVENQVASEKASCEKRA